jgi:hypothetical protein
MLRDLNGRPYPDPSQLSYWVSVDPGDNVGNDPLDAPATGYADWYLLSSSSSVGAQGPTGPTGAMGPMGPAGPVGATGSQGAKGDAKSNGGGATTSYALHAKK